MLLAQWTLTLCPGFRCRGLLCATALRLACIWRIYIDMYISVFDNYDRFIYIISGEPVFKKDVVNDTPTPRFSIT
jgi:hypothetical protein